LRAKQECIVREHHIQGKQRTAPVSAMKGMGFPSGRIPEPRGNRALPAGTIVVAADNHWSLVDDIFYERFPSHLKDKAPRLWTDEAGFHHWDVEGKSIFPSAIKISLGTFESVPGCTQLPARLDDLDAEGVNKEIVFGNGIGAFYAYPDLEVREWVFRIHNEHMAEIGAQAPGRFHGVGLINYWDLSRTRESIEEVKALGLKTFLIPQFPKGANGANINYCDPEMEPFWEALEESGLPICYHVGEVFHDGPGGMGTTAMTTFAPFRKNLGELIFGGIFDRHPGLQVVFAEGDINWVPGALQTAEMVAECHAISPKIKESPAYYWHKHCYATFMLDPAGLRLIDIIGADRVMWSSDYPHPESTFGLGWTAIQSIIDAVGDDDARMILGGTAMKVFNL
jgi:predicted TIM-barrel fold metal-dependent hydrolase